MVSIRKENDRFVFEVKGIHKLWAFKSELVVPIAHVMSAYQDPEKLQEWKDWRGPGTSIPHVFTAGTFHVDGDNVFWNLSDASKSIIVELYQPLNNWTDFSKQLVCIDMCQLRRYWQS